MRQKGKIKAWNDAKGCGFIQPLIDGKDIFFHISSFSNRRRRLKLDSS
ncbi:cold shock domain-containing protein [Nitrincola sp. A-D6]